MLSGIFNEENDEAIQEELVMDQSVVQSSLEASNPEIKFNYDIGVADLQTTSSAV